MSEKSSTERFEAHGLAAAVLLALCLALLFSGEATALAPGDAPPPIDLQDQRGAAVDLQELRGRVVLVDFWASWCPPCKEAMPFLQALHEKYAERGLVVVGINIDSSKRKMDKFLRSMPVSFRLAHDPKANVAQRYEIATMPTTVFIGRDGRVKAIHRGFHSEDARGIEEKVSALLAGDR